MRRRPTPPPRVAAASTGPARGGRATPPRRKTFYDAVYTVVRAIPCGRVVTYGTVATWLGSPRAARAVGYALAADAAGPLPWQRVVNAQGTISIGGALWRPEEQLRRLRAEKVAFAEPERIDLEAARFHPSRPQLRRWLALGLSLRSLPSKGLP